MKKYQRLITRFFILTIITASLVACLPYTPVPQPSETVSKPVATVILSESDLPFDEFIESSYHQILARNPEYITELGLADAFGIRNDTLTDISDEYVRQTQQLEADTLEALRAYNRSELTPEQQLSYDVYEWYLADRIKGYEFMYYDYPVTQTLTGVQNQLLFLFTDLQPVYDQKSVEDYLNRLSQVEIKIKQLIANLELRKDAGIVAPRLILEWSLRGIQRIASAEPKSTPLYQTLEQKMLPLSSIHPSDQEKYLASCEREIKVSVIPAFQSLAEYLGDLIEVAPAEVGVWQLPDGERFYAYLLHHFTTTDMTADQIHALGLSEVARIRGEMRQIYDQLGYPQDASLAELIERAAQESGILSGSALVSEYETIIQEADQVSEAYFDLKPRTGVIVIGGETGGFYQPPAVDGSRPGAFYASITSPLPRFNMASLAYHEAIPGHHTQIAIAQNLDLPTIRKDVSFTAYVEGWALYAERLAFEMGLYDDDPYGNLGRLQYEIYRAVRLVVDTGIHAKRWTFNQAVEYMQENTGFSRSRSESEIARYAAWPGQATAYKIGMLNLLDMRKMAIDQLGDQFDLKQFHNIVLGNGPLPLPLLERVLIDEITRIKREP